MKRCRNCDLTTLATRDWACPWCGAPLRTETRLDYSYAEAVSYRRTVPSENDKEITPPKGAKPKAQAETQHSPDYESENSPVCSQTPEMADDLLHTQDEEDYLGRKEVKGRQQNFEEVCHEEPVSKATCEEPAQVEIEEEPAEEDVQEESVIILGPGPGWCSTEQQKEPEPPLEELPEENQPEELPERPAEEPEPAVEIDITIETLLDAYKQDAISAEQKFDNSTMAITGTIAMVDINERRGIHTIALSGSDLDMFQSIRCVFNPERVAQLRELTKGQVVTIKGNFKGSLTAVSLVDCRLA